MDVAYYVQVAQFKHSLKLSISGCNYMLKEKSQNYDLTTLNYIPDFCQFYIFSSFLRFDTMFLITKSQNPYLLPAGHKTSRKGNQKGTWPQNLKSRSDALLFLVLQVYKSDISTKLFTSKQAMKQAFILSALRI